MGSQAFNPRTREVETEVAWLGRERNIRWEETEAQMQFEEQSEVAVGAVVSLRMLSEDRITPLV